MFTKSVWNDYATSIEFPPLEDHLTVDVAIIGGGITGITTAFLLIKAGYKVAVLEARKVGGGSTAHSTGNLYYTTDHLFNALTSKYDPNVLRSLTKARLEAMDLIEAMVDEYVIDCDFQRAPWYLYSATPEADDHIDEEYQAARTAGIPIETAAITEFPYPVRKGLKIPGQAQFNPVRYVRELARVISFSDSVFESTPVDSIEEHDGGVELKANGFTVKADYVIHATHTPKGKMLTFQALLGPYREYGVAARLASGEYPDGIFWGYHEGGEKFSVRSYVRGQDRYMIAVGQSHKVGQTESNKKHIQILENFLKDHFNTGEITHRWGGQNYRPADLLPYIGRKHTNSRIFVATGFATNGLVYGTLAGMIITDDIAGKTSRYAKLFDASRHRPIKAAGKFIKENLNVAVQFLKDGPFRGKERDSLDLAPGDGKVVERDDQKLAVYKDEEGHIHEHSAICPHMGCIVNWNNAEKTWDCPCHGSRFDVDGSVLEGPSLHPLKEADIHASANPD